MNLKDIQSLIEFISGSDIHEIKIQIGNTKIQVKNKIFKKKRKKLLNPIPVNDTDTIYSTISSDFSDRFYPKKKKEYKKNEYLTIKSPMIGTFYRKPHPDQDPFVKVGDEIKKGTKVCVIEAMKLFNEIESEVDGKIIKIFVENASPVDYDQPLFLLDPKIIK
ncbi:acetyl-CoA carboxylase biotin carboxyl carrier protein [Blattabacterium cuenoti]|uniref:acetyl-CoA carboxylase biotin carboxyl carrier protein n=1 Tax=Blattabacterium cuenoti TaxID=1653831 RepID=UPI00163B8CE7|nr:acetyl-CoA carboxylase biotin carboxyl carrier protein [Blattabacterium cuenoti]